MYTISELATAAEQGVDLTVVVWNNDALGQIRDDMIARGIPERDVAPRPPDFAGLATALGTRAVTPETIGAIAPAMRAARGTGPVMVVLDERRLAADSHSLAPKVGEPATALSEGGRA